MPFAVISASFNMYFVVLFMKNERYTCTVNCLKAETVYIR